MVVSFYCWKAHRKDISKSPKKFDPPHPLSAPPKVGPGPFFKLDCTYAVGKQMWIMGFDSIFDPISIKDKLQQQPWRVKLSPVQWARYYVKFCMVWYHLYNLKNTLEGVLAYNLQNVALLHRCFSRFWNCTNGTKSRNASHTINWKWNCPEVFGRKWK